LWYVFERRGKMKMKLMMALVGMAFLGLLFASLPAGSRPKEGKKVGKPCTHCHVKAGKPELNDIGNCYKEKRSLDSCP